MRYAQVFAASGLRLLPLQGGPGVIPGGGPGPDPDPGGPVGNRNAILWGACPNNLSGSDFEAMNAQFGPLTIRRSYQPAAAGMPASWAASNAGADVGLRASAWSGKPTMSSVASGALDGQILAFLRSIPPTHLAWVTIWHEPDGKIKDGVFTLSTYKAGFARFCQLIKQVQGEGWPHLYSYQCVTTWAGTNPSPGTTYADMWPGDGLVDCYGLDGYSHVGSGASLWGPGVAFARSKSIPWCVPEIGYGNTGTQDVSWLNDQVTYLTSTASGGHTKSAFACWFNTAGPISNPTPGNTSAWIAAAKTASQTHFTDYNQFVL